MHASLKTALFFTFATLALAYTEVDVEKAKKSGLHPFWASLSDLKSSVEESQLRIARDFNKVLLAEAGDTETWQRIFIDGAKFPFAEGEESLTPEDVKSKVIQMVGPLLENPSADFETQIAPVVAEADRLVKVQILGSLFRLVSENEGDLELKQEMITEVINHIKEKVHGMSVLEDSPVLKTAEKLESALLKVIKEISASYIHDATLLLGLLKNKFLFLKTEVSRLIKLHTSDTNLGEQEKIYIEKFRDALDLLGKVSLHSGNSDHFTEMVSEEIRKKSSAAMKSGSKAKSAQFVIRTPTLVAISLQAVTRWANPITAYGFATEYLLNMASTKSRDEVFTGLLREMAKNGLLPEPIATEDPTFAERSLKILAFIKNLRMDAAKETDKQLQEIVMTWWKSIVGSLEDILKVATGERMDRLDDIRLICSDSFGPYKEAGQYYNDRLDFMIRQVLDEEFAQDSDVEYFEHVIERVQELFTQAESDLHGSADHEFVAKYYFMIIMDALRFRNPEDQGSIDFQDFSQGALREIHLQTSSQITEYMMSYHFNKLAKDFNTWIKTTPEAAQIIKKKEMDERQFLLKFSGRSVPRSIFPVVSVSTNIETNKKDKKVGDLQKANFGNKVVGGQIKDLPKKNKVAEPTKIEPEIKEPILNLPEEIVIPKKEDPSPEDPTNKIEEKPADEEKPVVFLTEPRKNEEDAEKLPKNPTDPEIEENDKHLPSDLDLPKNTQKEEVPKVDQENKDPVKEDEPKITHTDDEKLPVDDQTEENEKPAHNEEKLPENPVELIVEDPKTENDSPSQEEKKPVVEEEKPVVEEEKPDTKEEKPLVGEEKLVVEEEKPLVEEKNPVVEEEKPDVEEEKPETEEDKPEVEEKQPVEKIDTGLPTNEPAEDKKVEEEIPNISNNRITPLKFPENDEDEEEEDVANGELIDLTPTAIVKAKGPEEIKNIIEQMKSEWMNPEELEELENAENLTDLIMKKEIEELPNGDVVEYIYIQLVEKGTPCFDTITG